MKTDSLDADSGQDASAIADLYRREREPMARLAFLLVRDVELADEIVHDAFVRLHDHYGRVRNPAGYVRTAVVNGCHSHHRHLRVVRGAPIERSAPAEIKIDHLDGELDEALSQLSHDHRVVLALRYFCDLDDHDIAQILGVRPATVRTRAHRALERLRKEITL